MEQQDGTRSAQSRSQDAYEAVSASILALHVREQCYKHVAKLRGVLRGMYRRPDPPPQISD